MALESVIGGAALACAAVFLPFSLAVPGHAQETIRVGYSPQIHDAAEIELQRDLGKRYKLEYVKFLRYADTEIALTRGDIQIGTLGYASAVVGALREPEPKYVYVTGLARGAINLVCRKDVAIKGWQDLKGKVYGVLTGGPAELFFIDALASHGVEPKDVQSVAFAAPGPPLLQALQSATIQCSAIFEPIAASTVADGYAYYPPVDLADNSFLGINHGIAVNAEFLRTHRSFVQEAVNSAVKTTAAYNRDHRQWIRDMEATGEFKPHAVEIGVDHLVLDNDLYLARLYKLAAAMRGLGFVRASPDEKVLAKYYVYDFLEKTTGQSADQLGRNK